MHTSPQLPNTGFVRLPVILHHIPVSPSTWWARVKKGDYPQPLKLGKQTTVWRAEDIRALIKRIGDVDDSANNDESSSNE